MRKKPDPDTVGEILDLHQRLRGGRKLTAREQRKLTMREHRTERRRIGRLLRDGKRRWAGFQRKQAAGENPLLSPPRSKIKARTEAKYRESLQRMGAFPPRGQAGRQAAAKANRERGDKTATRIQRLVLRGMKAQQIARRTHLSLATVYRYLPK